MEQLTTAALTQLPQVRALGRHTGRDPLTLFWTASGIELEFTGSELWVDSFADYEVVEPWVSVELNGAWVARFACRSFVALQIVFKTIISYSFFRMISTKSLNLL